MNPEPSTRFEELQVVPLCPKCGFVKWDDLACPSCKLAKMKNENIIRTAAFVASFLWFALRPVVSHRYDVSDVLAPIAMASTFFLLWSGSARWFKQFKLVLELQKSPQTLTTCYPRQYSCSICKQPLVPGESCENCLIHFRNQRLGRNTLTLLFTLGAATLIWSYAPHGIAIVLGVTTMALILVAAQLWDTRYHPIYRKPRNQNEQEKG